MRIEAFSFGSIRIDGVTYEHDVVIDPADRFTSARRSHPNSFATPLGTPPCPWKRIFLGDVAAR
jgi:hypothetical protein